MNLNNNKTSVTRWPTSIEPGGRTSVVDVSFDLREQDPNGARFNAVAQSALFTMVGCILGFVAAGILFDSGSPGRWLIVGACTCIGLVPLIRWARDRRNDDHRLDLHDVDPLLRPALLRAAGSADRVERAAASAPDGPVAELLQENRRSALANVKLLEHEARAGGAAHKPQLERVCRQLDELALTSEQLARTALEAQPRGLHTLTERTALVNEALTKDQADGLST